MEHVIAAVDCINVPVAPKQDASQWVDLAQARAECAAGTSRWAWAADDPASEVILACAGDVMVLETLAAVSILRTHAPSLRIRVVVVIDLFTLAGPRCTRTTQAARARRPGGVRVPRLPAHDPRAHLPPAHARPIPRSRLPRGGDDDDPVRHDRAETRQPLSPGLGNIEASPRTRHPKESEAIAACEAALRRHAEHIVREGTDLPEVTEWRW